MLHLVSLSEASAAETSSSSLVIARLCHVFDVLYELYLKFSLCSNSTLSR